MRAADVAVVWQALTIRPTRHHQRLVVYVGAYRLLCTFIPLLDPANVDRPDVVVRLVPLAVVVVAANVAVVALAIRVDVTDRRVSRLLLGIDAAIAVAVNVVAALVTPTSAVHPLDYSYWYVLQGTVALVVSLRGVPAALGLCAAGLPFALSLAFLRGAPFTPATLAGALLAALWLVLALFCGVLIFDLVRLHTITGRGEGVQEGTLAEKLRLSRALHDTVLQTLEAIALHAGTDAGDPRRRLRDIESAARGQARDLRATIDTEPLQAPGHPGHLGHPENTGRPGHPENTGHPGYGPATLRSGLIEVVEAARSRGMDAALLADDIPVDIPVDIVGVAAVRGAVGEALTNVTKHAGTRSAVVRAVVVDRTLEVDVTDRGRGLGGGARAGFGIQQSIIGRMRDVGGTAIVSAPAGGGTLVRLRLPLHATEPERGGASTPPGSADRPTGATSLRLR